MQNIATKSALLYLYQRESQLLFISLNTESFPG